MIAKTIILQCLLMLALLLSALVLAGSNSRDTAEHNAQPPAVVQPQNQAEQTATAASRRVGFTEFMFGFML